MDSREITVENRIIPARAGFTDEPPASNFGYEDHPRSRGVYVLARVHKLANTGSSPLARGLLVNAFGGCFTAMDHPRSRGVYASLALAAWAFAGSSPLARGLPAELKKDHIPCRIIPARAGFTK